MSKSRNYGQLAKFALGVASAQWGVGNMSYFLMPHLIEGLVSGEIGLSEKMAGLVGTIELLCLAFTIIVLSARIERIDKRKLAVGGIALAGLGYIASSFFDQVPMIAACRVFAGMGAGCAMAAANAMVAAHDEPEQVYAWSFIVITPIQALTIAVMPYFIELGGHAGAYAYQALNATFYLVVVFFLFPKDEAPPETQVKEKWFPKPMEMVMIGALFVFLVGDAGIWSFTERVAVSIGLDIKTVGLVLGVGVFAVPLGSALASAVGMRFGRYLPLVVGLGLMSTTVYMITHTAVQTVYMGSQISYNFAYAFALPFVYGTAAAMDPKGRVVVAAMGIGLIGGAIAPFLSGLLAETTGSYGVLGSLYGIIFLIVLVLTALAARTIKSGDS